MKDLKDLLQEGYCSHVNANKEICDECERYFGKCTEKCLITANDFMEYAKANFEQSMTKEEAEKIMIKYGICMTIDCDVCDECCDCKYSTKFNERERAMEVLKNDN